MVFVWGRNLYGEVQNARDVFVVRTEFTHAYGIPIAPERSYLCLLKDASVRRRAKVVARTDTTAIGYGRRASRGKKVISAAIPIGLQWRSVLHAYLLPAAIALLVVTLFSGIIYLEERWPKALAFAIISPIASVCLFLLRLNRFDLNYEQAAKLAVLAQVDESVIEQIQVAYGRFPDCAIIHGRPVSSRRVLYVYADSEVDARTAKRIFRELRTFAYGRSWQLGEIWPINTASVVDGQISRELGVVAALPRERADSREDIMAIVQAAAKLNARFGLNFAVGIYDTVARASEDLFLVDSPQPGIARLEASLSKLQSSPAGRA